MFMVNVVIFLLILSYLPLKEEHGQDFVAATVGHSEFVKWSYNPKEKGVIITPPPNINVFVKEEKTWVIGQQGDLKPIVVRIEIW